VARSGTFVAAGAVLGVEHTTVSRRVSALEKSLGRPVIVRTSRGCSLTDFGRSLMDGAEQIERTLEVRTMTGRPRDFSRALTRRETVVCSTPSTAPAATKVPDRATSRRINRSSAFVTVAPSPVHSCTAAVHRWLLCGGRGPGHAHPMQIAWIGLGNMGGPMAANLVAAGHDVLGFDLSRSAQDAASGKGVAVAASVADAVAGRTAFSPTHRPVR
jgi:hypothetical protein